MEDSGQKNGLVGMSRDFSSSAKAFGSDSERRIEYSRHHPVRVPVARSLDVESERGIGQSLGVPAEDLSLTRDEFLNAVELHSAECRLELAHLVFPRHLGTAECHIAGQSTVIAEKQHPFPHAFVVA